MKPNRIPLFLFSALLLFCGMEAQFARADTVVVISARASIERISKEEVIHIFLGRYRRLPSGAAAFPIDQPANSRIRTEFYRNLVNKDPDEINAYWARLVFSGKTRPPQQASSTAEMIKILASTPGAIGYIERNQVDSRLRIVLELTP